MNARVLHVITGLGLGGAERTLLALTVAGVAGAGAAVISLGDRGVLGEALESAGARVLTLEMPPGRARWSGLRRLLGLADELRPALIQGWMYHGNLAASLAGWWLGADTPVLWNVRHAVHDLRDEKRSTAAVIRLTARLPPPRGIIYNSVTAAAQHARLGYRPERAEVIPNGFDGQRFRPSEAARARLREELGLPADARLVGMLARCHPIKDHANFLAAAARLRSSGVDAHFVLAGPGVEPGRAPFAAGDDGHALAGRLHLLGQRNDAPQLLSALDALANSSRSEAFPNAVGEAMACGVPCVVTDVGDCRVLVGDTGIVVPPSDPAALADGVRRLLELDPQSRRRLGAAARARVLERFSSDAMVRRYDALYARIMRGA